MLSDVVKIHTAVLTFFSLAWTVALIIPRYTINLGADLITVGVVIFIAPLAIVATRAILSNNIHH